MCVCVREFLFVCGLEFTEIVLFLNLVSIKQSGTKQKADKGSSRLSPVSHTTKQAKENVRRKNQTLNNQREKGGIKSMIWFLQSTLQALPQPDISISIELIDIPWV